MYVQNLEQFHEVLNEPEWISLLRLDFAKSLLVGLDHIDLTNHAQFQSRLS